MIKCHICKQEVDHSYFMRVPDIRNKETRYAGYIIEVCRECYIKHKGEHIK